MRFIVLAICLTGDLLRECAFSSRKSAFDQERRLRRPARLIGIAYLSNKKPRLDRLCKNWGESDREGDPPPLKWSDLRYVFDIKEDCNGKEAIQA